MNGLIGGKSARTKAGRKLWDGLDFSRARIDESTAAFSVGALSVPHPADNTIHRIWPAWLAGDVLWVRESIRTTSATSAGEPLAHPAIWYLADGPRPDPEAYPNTRPSIHMPRRASRITLEVIRVWPERLLNISEEDALAEGIQRFQAGRSWNQDGYSWKGPGGPLYSSARAAFWALWDSINAKRGYGADKNPWVWARKFKVVRGAAARRER